MDLCDEQELDGDVNNLLRGLEKYVPKDNQALILCIFSGIAVHGDSPEWKHKTTDVIHEALKRL